MKPVRKLYRATPVNKEIEQKERVLWLLKNGTAIADIKLELPYRTESELTAYVQGLKTARILMAQPLTKKQQP